MVFFGNVGRTQVSMPGYAGCAHGSHAHFGYLTGRSQSAASTRRSASYVPPPGDSAREPVAVQNGGSCTPPSHSVVTERRRRCTALAVSYAAMPACGARTLKTP
jgi:hypothetical protein